MTQAAKSPAKGQQVGERLGDGPPAPDLAKRVVERDHLSVEIGDKVYLQRLSTATDLEGEPKVGEKP